MYKIIVQVRLQKEQENRVKLELQVAELEEQVDQRASDLSAAVEEKERLKTNLDQERESKQVGGVCLCLHSTVFIVSIMVCCMHMYGYACSTASCLIGLMRHWGGGGVSPRICRIFELHVHTCTLCVHVLLYTYMYAVYTHALAHTHTPVYICVYMYIYTCTYTYTPCFLGIGGPSE